MKATFTSLDRQTTCSTEYEQPDRYRQIASLPEQKGLIARGAGISYVGASFAEGGRSISMRRFDRILAFDPVRRTIEVEAGISLGQLYDFLLPHGLFLAIQPGYPEITVGGCIAFNIHGKNQYREGNFANVVNSVRLFHPCHGMTTASRTQDPDLLELTVGGLGLTGIVLSAELALGEIPGESIEIEHLPFATLADGVRLVSEVKDRYDLVYCWSDLSISSRQGRGYVVAGRFVKEAVKTKTPRGKLRPSSKRLRPPLLRGPLSAVVNSAYYANAMLKKRHRVPIHSALFPAVGREFYFDMFGQQGFVEQQTLVPSSSLTDYVPEFVATVKAHAVPIALTTIKAAGGQDRLLSYGGDGISLTIDVEAGPAAARLLDALDELNIRYRAKSSITKDSRISAAVVERQYPQYGMFRDRLRNHDPKRLFCSALSERLGL